jgi:hypothetical protein
MVVNRKGADERRDRLLEGFPTRTGFDRESTPRPSAEAGPTGTSAASCAGSTPLAGWRMSPTSRAARTARTAQRLARSSACSATAHGSDIASGEIAPALAVAGDDVRPIATPVLIGESRPDTNPQPPS